MQAVVVGLQARLIKVLVALVAVEQRQVETEFLERLTREAAAVERISREVLLALAGLVL
jgi:hypothetical protein